MAKPSKVSCECEKCRSMEPQSGAEPVVVEAKEAAPTVARSEVVTVGRVECLMRPVPIEAVLGLLNPDGLRRIEATEGTASFESARQRLLASDGRAAPVFFEAAELAAGPPSILHGFDEIAAAKVCGIPEVFVILVPSGGASEAQSHIVEMVRRQRVKKQSSDDDELFYRVHAEA